MTKKKDTTTKDKAEHGNNMSFDWKVFDALMQFKVSKAFVADYMKVSKTTIDNKLKKEHDKTFTEYGSVKMERTGYKLQQKAIEMALGGNTTMMIFALKNLAKWSDNNEVAITELPEIVLSYRK
tara:strand:- start:24047 stop:24418 length:372 start_codon:yes stop_codon:yes gene_type:complete